MAVRHLCLLGYEITAHGPGGRSSLVASAASGGTLPGVDWRARVDRWWAQRLRLPVDAIESGGRFALDHVDHVGVLEVPGRPPLLYAPPAVAATLDGVPLNRDTTVVRAAVDALADRVAGVLGPTWYGYATTASLADSGAEVRALTAADLDALAQLHRETPPEQVDESGTDDLPAFGVFDGARLVAVACLKAWHDMPTIGVLTHPAARAHGLARQVVAAAARAGLERRPEVQYRASRENRASIAVGRACGFVHYGDGCVIELTDTSPRQ
jgi:GNAT superfamily N-acetyltransferase